jgi:hypothetical protein
MLGSNSTVYLLMAFYIYSLFVEMENIARKFGLQINQEKAKYMIVERKNCLKKGKIGHLKIKNYKFERVENFK